MQKQKQEAEKLQKQKELYIKPKFDTSKEITIPIILDIRVKKFFNKFKDFDKFKIHNIIGSKNLKSLKLETNNIFIMSKQLLQKYINEKTIMDIKNLKLDIIAFDENHFSGTTQISKDIMESYPYNHMRTRFRLFPRRFRRHNPILICDLEDCLNLRRSYKENCFLIQ